MLKRLLASCGFELRRLPKNRVRRPPAEARKPVSLLGDGRYCVPHKRARVAGDHFFVPDYALHRPAARKLLKGEIHEPDTHRFVAHFCARNPGSAIHAGTFFGDMLPTYSRAVSGLVHAFEPVLENFIMAKLCVETNQLANVMLFNAALGRRVEVLRIDTADRGGRHAGGGAAIAEHGDLCATMTIDQLGSDDIVLVQLDVEGHELAALAGAERTIAACRPVIAVEDNRDQCSKFLSDRGYSTRFAIPGLALWAPEENEKFLNDIEAFFTGAATP